MNLSLWDVSSRLMSIVVYMVMCVCVSKFSVDLPISDTYACVCVCLTLDQSLLSLSVCGQRISLPLSSLIPSPPSPSRDEFKPTCNLGMLLVAIGVLATSLLQHFYTVFNITRLDLFLPCLNKPKRLLVHMKTLLQRKVFNQGWTTQSDGDM